MTRWLGVGDAWSQRRAAPEDPHDDMVVSRQTGERHMRCVPSAMVTPAAFRGGPEGTFDVSVDTLGPVRFAFLLEGLRSMAEGRDAADALADTLGWPRAAVPAGPEHQPPRKGAAKPTALDPDAGRRVLQCKCGRARPWTGREDALAAGWRSRWVNDTRVWDCPEHVVEAAPAPPPEPPNLTPPQRVIRFAFGTAREREQVRRDLARLLEMDPERGRAWAIAVLDKVADGNGDRPKEWRDWAVKHGLRKQTREAEKRRRAKACTTTEGTERG